MIDLIMPHRIGPPHNIQRMILYYLYFFQFSGIVRLNIKIVDDKVYWTINYQINSYIYLENCSCGDR